MSRVKLTEAEVEALRTIASYRDEWAPIASIGAPMSVLRSLLAAGYIYRALGKHPGRRALSEAGRAYLSSLGGSDDR